MKKILSLLICLILMLSVLTSCNNEVINSSESSASSDFNENSDASEASGEIKIPPENVLYFTGYYTPTDDWTGEDLFANPLLQEFHSCRDGLRDRLRYGCFSDVYFLVGVWGDAPGDNYDENPEFTKKYLDQCGFIEIEDHPMKYDAEAYAEMREKGMNGTAEDRSWLTYNYAKKLLPDVEFGGGARIAPLVNSCIFYYVGYISVYGLRELAQLLEYDSATYNSYNNKQIAVTWFPAPDDQRRWLTFDPDYRD